MKFNRYILTGVLILGFQSLGLCLTAGDLAFTAFNSDGDDDFAIVALKDIPANSTIYFSDNEPNSNGSGFLDTGEGTLEWLSGGSVINAGTIIVFTDVDNDANTNFGSSIGSLSDASFDAGLNLSGEGDALYAVEGSPDGNNISAWLAGIQNAAGNEGAYFNQTGLTAGTTFINYYDTSSPDGGYYSGSRTGESSFSAYLSLLGKSSNWTEDVSNGESILPISTTSFTVDNSLPVVLSSWKATSTQGQVKLLWTTDSEIENQGFIIERCKVETESDRKWTEITSFATNPDLQGQGSTSAQNDYIFIDKQVKVGQTYSYRLSDVDYRGNVTRHAEISVTVKDAGHDLKPSDMTLHEAYPNPFNPVTTVSFTRTVTSSHATSLQVYDVNGRFVETLYDGPTEPGTYTVTWDGGNLSSGIYFMRLSSGNDVRIQRVTLLR